MKEHTLKKLNYAKEVLLEVSKGKSLNNNLNGIYYEKEYAALEVVINSIIEIIEEIKSLKATNEQT